MLYTCINIDLTAKWSTLSHFSGMGWEEGRGGEGGGGELDLYMYGVCNLYYVRLVLPQGEGGLTGAHVHIQHCRASSIYLLAPLK